MTIPVAFIVNTNTKWRLIIMENRSNAVKVKREWADYVLQVVRFFVQHSTIEVDGMERKISVKYHGSNGYVLSFDTRPERQFDIHS